MIALFHLGILCGQSRGFCGVQFDFFFKRVDKFVLSLRHVVKRLSEKANFIPISYRHDGR